MSEDTTVVAPPLHHRVRHGLRRPHNWFQLIRFGVVGASGYAVNLVVFALAVHGLGVGYQVAAVLGFIVSVLNNFWWNRHWTFGARDGHAGFQAMRFFVVSIGAFVVSYVILTALVEAAGLPQVLAQAIALVAATPANFLGQKLWSFGR
ncbi:MAG TPA: GtrA family protein [Conexibacter sp.]|jgi:putative flippase GtrA